MIAVLADTHALIWAFFNNPLLSLPARQAMDRAAANGDQIGVSAISVVELIYLAEKGKVQVAVLEGLLLKLRDPSSTLHSIPLTDAIAEEMRNIPRADIPDMPDRIIAATALHLGIPLISKDRKIQLAAVSTIW